MRARLLVTAFLLLLPACGDPAPPAAAPSSAASAAPLPAGSPLPPGKSDVVLRPGRYRSPDGFVPALSVEVSGTGWRSAHRFDDMFDVGRPEPGKDLPRVAVAFSVAGGTEAAVLADLVARAGPAAARPVATTFARQPATRLDVTGGGGELYRSRTGGFGLYMDPAQRLRLVVATVGGAVVVVAVIVPDRARWAAMLPLATAVLDSARA
jgi:hypothetical protein